MKNVSEFWPTGPRRFTRKIAQELLPKRGLTSNKTTFGNVAVCAGHPGFWGAGVLATEAAFRIGAGYVTWASTTPPVEELKNHPEVLTATLSQVAKNPKVQAFVVGPGLGIGGDTLTLIQQLQKRTEPVLLDADAITTIAQAKLAPLPKHWILTPHTGEMSRLLGLSSKEIEQDRYAAVAIAQKKYGCVVLLKGRHTLVANKKTCQIITSGNPALAKAGTGDVLSGFIGGLLAQGLSPIKAASLGAYIHGALADKWVSEGNDVASLVASDLVHALPEFLRSLRLGRE